MPVTKMLYWGNSELRDLTLVYNTFFYSHYIHILVCVYQSGGVPRLALRQQKNSWKGSMSEPSHWKEPPNYGASPRNIIIIII